MVRAVSRSDSPFLTDDELTEKFMVSAESLFAAAPNEAVSRERLVGDLAGDEGAETQERAVDVQITRLRRKIEPDPRRRRLILCEASGYRLNLDRWSIPEQDLALAEFRASA